MSESDATVAQLHAAHKEIMRRLQAMAATPDARDGQTPLLVTVPNCGRMFAARRDALRLAEGIAKMGRKTNVWLVLTGPDAYPTVADVGPLLRDFVAAGAVEYRHEAAPR